MRGDDDDNSAPNEMATITFRGKRYSAINALGAAVVALSVAFTAMANIGIELFRAPADTSDRYYGKDGDRDRKAREAGDADIRRDHEKEILRISANLARLEKGLENCQVRLNMGKSREHETIQGIKDRIELLMQGIYDRLGWLENKAGR